MNDHPVPLGLKPSFGFGDRLGAATPGHIASCRGSGIAPIYAQQSIREMTRTQRTPDQVMEAARSAVQAAAWAEPWGADADHLKTPADVDYTAAAGFCFFTIDPSEYVDGQADDYNEATLRQKFATVQGEIGWFDTYKNQEITLGNGTRFVISEQDAMRAAVKYGRAINHTISLAQHIHDVHAKNGRDYEIELSVDETPQPTTLAEHYIIAEQCLAGNVKLVSLAPRFIGELEKGVDYIGDVAEVEKSIADHHAIAKRLGPYKLSLHSGSDKISMYTGFARATEGLFHVKTAGTSYLEALRVAALREPAFFREICAFSRSRYDVDKATYHVHATLSDVPAPSEIADAKKLEQLYLECWEDVPAGQGFTAPGRQILHCTFGSVVTDPVFGPRLRECLVAHSGTYREILHIHFQQHLNALLAGLK